MTSETFEPLRFSVIVASWKRPFWLKRCLRAVAQLDYPAFEVIVVADGDSLNAIDASHLKCVPFNETNLSKARNAGIGVSGGDVCAFIDDDAVPEPMWLHHLSDAFLTTEAVAATGYVRGRNGISFQSRVASVDAEAETHVEPEQGPEPFVPTIASGRALKLIGTNMAVRRDVFVKIGGFDEGYRYFLEDSDFSLRIAGAGFAAAVAPLAEVHHAFAASSRRSRQRAPRDLFDIGRSSALFVRRHLDRDFDVIRKRLRHHQRARLCRHMVSGTCEPRDVGRLLAGLMDGWDDGMSAPLRDMPSISTTEAFRPLPVREDGHVVLGSRLLILRRHARGKAETIAKNGQRVSLFSFSLTPIRHHLRYTDSGIWLQTGGQFGRSERGRPIFRWCRFAQRQEEEIHRVAKARGIGKT